MSDLQRYYDYSGLSPVIPIITHDYKDFEKAQRQNLNKGNADGTESFNWILCYSDDIYDYWRSVEEKRIEIKFSEQSVIYRPVLLGLIRNLMKLNTNEESNIVKLHLAIHILDICLSENVYPEDELKVLATACFLVASKMEEDESNVPNFSEINTSMLCSRFSLDTYKIYETRVLICIKFELLAPTVATFVNYFSRISLNLEDFHNYKQNLFDFASIENSNTYVSFDSYDDMLKNVNNLMLRLTDITVDDINLINFYPSLKAAACIAAARILYNIQPIWTRFLETQTHYKEYEVITIAKIIASQHESRLFNTFIPTNPFIENIHSDHTYSVPNFPQIITVAEIPNALNSNQNL